MERSWYLRKIVIPAYTANETVEKRILKIRHLPV